MRKINSLLFILTLLIVSFGYGQNNNFQEIVLSKYDSLMASKISELKLPECYKNGQREDLPWKVNNAELPFFRPVFQQEGASCGQAAGVGYNFTYEMNCARGTDASLAENQYPTHFAWNWMNGGYGINGVSYFHSFDLLKYCGTPSVETYGGMTEGGVRRWMSGYDNYYNAMLNRVKDVFFIDVKTPEGVLTLKHWLNDHLNDSEYGGVASFYAHAPYDMRILDEDTPEAGKHIVVNWESQSSHALTIVGYNDSIRYDFNQDGQFTNDIDINSDGVVDMKDWEFGAFLFANSYDDYWADSGFCYMMYRALAYKYEEGAIWNESVHVVSVDENYTPELTMRLKIKHNSRECIKVIAGISEDTSIDIPEYSIDFPLLNFQGGSLSMQGLFANDTLDPKILEVELDITPLLSKINSGVESKFFIQIVENDDLNIGSGEILYFSLVDRTSENITEVVNQQMPFEISNNSITTLSVISSVSFDKPLIITEELPVYLSSENYNVNLNASGGQPPYEWSLSQDYFINPLPKDFPEVLGDEIVFDDMDHGHVNFNLKFPFPYYGDTIDQVSVAVDGLVSFEEEGFAYPYFLGETTMLSDRKIIAPFLTDLYLDYYDYSSNDGVWVESTSEYFCVIWSASYVSHPEFYSNLLLGDFNFALKLYPDGKIEFYYGDFDIPLHIMWLSGISNGDKTNYEINPFLKNLAVPSGNAFVYSSNPLPSNIEINSQGLLSVSNADENVIYNISAIVKDEKRISNKKSFQLSSGLIYEYEISSGNDDEIDFTETASLKLTVKNISTQSIENISFRTIIEDENIDLLKNETFIGNLSAGESIVVDTAVLFTVSESTPDQHTFTMENEFYNNIKTWSSSMSLTVNALEFILADLIVTNDENGILEPGETVTLKIVLQNVGHSSGSNFDFEFASNNEYLILKSSTEHIDYVGLGEKVEVFFDVKALNWTPHGTIVPATVGILNDIVDCPDIQVPVKIGKVPVLFLQLSADTNSVFNFGKVFDSLNIPYEIAYSCPEYFNNYTSVFVCLGDLFSAYELSSSEGFKLNRYLDDGGKIYMEGMHTWNDDEQFALHNKFNINSVSNGNYFEIDSVYGVDGQLTEGIKMEYGGSMNFNNHYLEPMETAFPFLHSSKTDTSCVIANQTWTYKTIGSSLLFGQMINAEKPENELNYVKAILDFFEIEIQYEDINENLLVESNPKFVCFPNPFGNVLNLTFFGSGEEDASFMIYDVNGRLVKYEELPKIPVNEKYETLWDAKSNNGELLPSGIYFVKYLAGKYSSTAKLILQ
jgi:hypothetical protein